MKILRQKDLSMLNIDDYIRQRVKSGAKSIMWGNHGLKIISKYLGCLTGTASFRISEIHGLRFLGVKHYIRGYKK